MFYGYYSSYNGDKNFTTISQNDLLFPPQVIYNDIIYRFVRAFQANTPSQHKSFAEFCVKQNCETGVNI